MFAVASPRESFNVYKGPDPKEPASVRLRRSTRRGLNAVVDLWRLRAAHVGDEAGEVNFPYVVDTLLSIGVMTELKQYLDINGELPTSESDWNAVLERIREHDARDRAPRSR